MGGGVSSSGRCAMINAVPGAPILYIWSNNKAPEAHRSARHIEQRDADHAIRHAGDGSRGRGVDLNVRDAGPRG